LGKKNYFDRIFYCLINENSSEKLQTTKVKQTQSTVVFFQ
jgi:hypothetical protein